MACRTAGFEQADSRVAVLREAGGEYAPGRAGTDDDVVEAGLGVDRASPGETAASAKTK
jgi:hypothetical protein